MTDQTAADRAIATMDGAEIDDRKISVRIAEDKNPAKPEPVRNSLQKSFPSKPGFTPRSHQQETPKRNVRDGRNKRWNY